MLTKRENYRDAFVSFDAKKVARFTEQDIETFLQNQGIIRNRLKVQAAVVNAQKFLDVQKEFGSFAAYQWEFVGGAPIQHAWRSISDVPAVSAEAKTLSKDLKRRGFKFIGPTTIYAYMQAIGMVNDHTTNCFRYQEVKRLANKQS